MKTLVFFNNKGGVGKTSLVYHLAHIYAEIGLNVIACDMDPQANLSAMFLEEDRLSELWPDGPHDHTILGCVQPVLDGTGDIRDPHVEDISDNLGLIVGDLGLSSYEDILSSAWPNCNQRSTAPKAFRATTAFYRIMLRARESRNADLILVDIGPNLGAINRAALISCEHVAIPLTPDLFSLQGLKNLGPAFKNWREEWENRLQYKPADVPAPAVGTEPVGYIIHQHRIRLDRPTKSYVRWVERIPHVYREAVLYEDLASAPKWNQDKYCLSLVKHYQSLMPMAMEARKPIFHLTPADGAIASHMEAVRSCRKDFVHLATRLSEVCDFEIPELQKPQ